MICLIILVKYLQANFKTTIVLFLQNHFFVKGIGLIILYFCQFEYYPHICHLHKTGRDTKLFSMKHYVFCGIFWMCVKFPIYNTVDTANKKRRQKWNNFVKIQDDYFYECPHMKTTHCIRFMLSYWNNCWYWTYKYLNFWIFIPLNFSFLNASHF